MKTEIYLYNNSNDRPQRSQLDSALEDENSDAEIYYYVDGLLPNRTPIKDVEENALSGRIYTYGSASSRSRRRYIIETDLIPERVLGFGSVIPSLFLNPGGGYLFFYI